MDRSVSQEYRQQAADLRATLAALRQELQVGEAKLQEGAGFVKQALVQQQSIASDLKPLARRLNEEIEGPSATTPLYEPLTEKLKTLQQLLGQRKYYSSLISFAEKFNSCQTAEESFNVCKEAIESTKLRQCSLFLVAVVEEAGKSLIAWRTASAVELDKARKRIGWPFTASQAVESSDVLEPFLEALRQGVTAHLGQPLVVDALDFGIEFLNRTIEAEGKAGGETGKGATPGGDGGGGGSVAVTEWAATALERLRGLKRQLSGEAPWQVPLWPIQVLAYSVERRFQHFFDEESAVEEANNPEVVLGYGLSLIRSHDFFLRSHCQRVVDETLAAHMRSCTAFQVHAPSHFASIIVTRMVAKCSTIFSDPECPKPLRFKIVEELLTLQKDLDSEFSFVEDTSGTPTVTGPLQLGPPSPLEKLTSSPALVELWLEADWAVYSEQLKQGLTMDNAWASLLPKSWHGAASQGPGLSTAPPTPASHVIHSVLNNANQRLLILCLQHLQGKLSLLLESLEAAAEESSPAALFSRLHTAFEGAERKDSTTEESIGELFRVIATAHYTARLLRTWDDSTLFIDIVASRGAKTKATKGALDSYSLRRLTENILQQWVEDNSSTEPPRGGTEQESKGEEKPKEERKSRINKAATRLGSVLGGLSGIVKSSRLANTASSWTKSLAKRAEDVASVALQGMEAVVNQAWAPAMSLLGPEAGGSSSDPSAPLFSASEKAFVDLRNQSIKLTAVLLGSLWRSTLNGYAAAIILPSRTGPPGGMHPSSHIRKAWDALHTVLALGKLYLAPPLLSLFKLRLAEAALKDFVNACILQPLKAAYDQTPPPPSCQGLQGWDQVSEDCGFLVQQFTQHDQRLKAKVAVQIQCIQEMCLLLRLPHAEAYEINSKIRSLLDIRARERLPPPTSAEHLFRACSSENDTKFELDARSILESFGFHTLHPMAAIQSFQLY